MAAWKWALAVGGLGLVATGCGSGGNAGPPNCAQVQPCGGDVTGTWSFLGTCTNLVAENQQFQDTCPGEAVNSASASLTGLITFGADGTYTASNWHETFAGTETIPLSCNSSVSNCTQNNGTMSDSSQGQMATITTTCSGTSTCVCSVSGTAQLTTGTGTYGAVNEVVSVTGGPLSGAFPYCVEQNRLHLMQTFTTVSTAMPNPVTTILSDIVAVKQ